MSPEMMGPEMMGPEMMGPEKMGLDSGHTDCEKVLDRMYAFLDSELPEADCDEIRRHLADCEPCLDQFDVEQAMKQLVGRCCRGETAPPSLIEKVQFGLRQTRGEP